VQKSVSPVTNLWKSRAKSVEKLWNSNRFDAKTALSIPG
jgi:hypothetical protein